MVKTFNSVNEFVNCLMDNEGKLFFDHYGREWMYDGYFFTFKDIGAGAVHTEGLKCLHLYGTLIEMME